MDMDLLKLVALDRDDIAIISVHLQDAVMKVADVRWRPEEQRLVLGLNRFDWEAAGGTAPVYRRRRTALRFDRALSLQCRNLRPTDKDAALNLLAVEFDEHDSPGGTVIMTFSGGAALRLEVECLEVELVDLGPTWTTVKCPKHPTEADARG